MIGAGLVKRAACDLLPVYGTLMGLLVGFTVRLLFMTQLGSLLCQWPLGRLSDRADRRLVLVGLTACVCLTSLWIASGAAGTGVLLGFAITVWGACSLSTYAIGMAHAADHAAADEMVVVTSSALLAWGIGGMIGPAIAAPLLDLLGPAGFFLYAAAVSGVVTLFVLWRRAARAAPEAKSAFVNVSVTSPRLGELDLRGQR